MNANGAHPQYRQQQQVQGQRDKRSHGVDLPVNNGISHGPMQTHIQVAKPFVFHQTIEGCLDDLCVAVTRDEQYRIAGVRWIDDVRKALKLYVSVPTNCPLPPGCDGGLPCGRTRLMRDFFTDRSAHLTPQLCTTTNFVFLTPTTNTTLRYANAVFNLPVQSWSCIQVD